MLLLRVDGAGLTRPCRRP